jgi:hypothetical protein
VHVGVVGSGRGRVRPGIWIRRLTRRLRTWKIRATKGRGGIPRERMLRRWWLLSWIHRARRSQVWSMIEIFFLLALTSDQGVGSRDRARP